jgi:hypothetical protein
MIAADNLISLDLDDHDALNAAKSSAESCATAAHSAVAKAQDALLEAQKEDARLQRVAGLIPTVPAITSTSAATTDTMAPAATAASTSSPSALYTPDTSGASNTADAPTAMNTEVVASGASDSATAASTGLAISTTPPLAEELTDFVVAPESEQCGLPPLPTERNTVSTALSPALRRRSTASVSSISPPKSSRRSSLDK